MSVLFVLIFFSVIVAAVFLGAFIWAIRKGQFDDDQSPAHRILFDDKPTSEDNKQK